MVCRQNCLMHFRVQKQEKAEAVSIFTVFHSQLFHVHPVMGETGDDELMMNDNMIYDIWYDMIYDIWYMIYDLWYNRTAISTKKMNHELRMANGGQAIMFMLVIHIYDELLVLWRQSLYVSRPTPIHPNSWDWICIIRVKTRVNHISIRLAILLQAQQCALDVGSRQKEFRNDLSFFCPR